MKKAELNKEAILIAEDYGVDANTAICVIELLGESELHDGFICAMEDAAIY